MSQIYTKKKIMKWVEIIFDVTYLVTVLMAAVVLHHTAEAGSLRWQYAMMSFLLGVGDAFHLIPRIYTKLDRKERDHTVSLGLGKFITSITMTLFYLLLWEIGKAYYSFYVDWNISLLAYGAAFLRVLLCVFPQNGWTDKKPSLNWGIVRNIPFLVLGMTVMILYMIGAFKFGGDLSFVWITILFSFICYMPVVLFIQKNPKVGMLMLPKSCAYIAIVLMGFYVT